MIKLEQRVITNQEMYFNVTTWWKNFVEFKNCWSWSILGIKNWYVVLKLSFHKICYFAKCKMTIGHSVSRTFHIFKLTLELNLEGGNLKRRQMADIKNVFGLVVAGLSTLFLLISMCLWKYINLWNIQVHNWSEWRTMRGFFLSRIMKYILALARTQGLIRTSFNQFLKNAEKPNICGKLAGNCLLE